MSMIQRFLFATVLLFSISLPLGAQEALGYFAGQSIFRGSIGAFSPDGDSQYWADKEFDFTAVADDYEDFTFAGDYLHYLSARVGLLASFGVWEGSATQSYRDFVDNFGGEISHVTKLQTAWLDLGMVLSLLGRRAVVMPYVGAGGSLVSFGLTEEGEFIDFGFSPPEVIRDRYLADGDTFGFFWLAGFEVPLGAGTALFAEARWRVADVELEQDFSGLGTLDLSGRALTAGISFSF